MTTAELEPLDALLDRHGLAAAVEEPFPNDGWSGASMSLLRRGADGARFVLKRDSLDRDWIARSTADGELLREAWFAVAGPDLPAAIRAPYLGVGRDAVTGETGILMPDLGGILFDWETPLAPAELGAAIDGIAALHAHAWPDGALARGAGRWCPVRERIALICRAALERPGPAREAVGGRILPGWEAFDRLAPPAGRALVARLGADPGPLVEVLGRLPSTLVHGDLKLANAGIAADGVLELVDWQMTGVMPVAVELGWFLVANVASLPLPPADVAARYHAAMVSSDGGVAAIGDWQAQLDAAILVGLLLRGWRKGVDAEAGISLASGVTAADDLAWWCDRALEAAGRAL